MLGEIDNIRKAESCFGIQEIFWVRNLFKLRRVGCKNVCGIIDDSNSLTLAEEKKKFVLSLKLEILEVRDPSQLHFYSLLEFLEYSNNLVD